MLAAIVKKRGRGTLKKAKKKVPFVDKTPLSLHWPEKKKKNSSVKIAAAAALHQYYFPLHCCGAAFVSWRCCLEARVEPDPPRCLAMSSLTHALLLCAPPSASGGCPSPP